LVVTDRYGAIPRPNISCAALWRAAAIRFTFHQRYLAGESPSLLAREYGISEQWVFVIIRKFKSQEGL